jgi:hypothetical protein
MAQNALRLVDGDAGLGLDGTPRAASVLTWVEH